MYFSFPACTCHFLHPIKDKSIKKSKKRERKQQQKHAFLSAGFPFLCFLKIEKILKKYKTHGKPKNMLVHFLKCKKPQKNYNKKPDSG